VLHGFFYLGAPAGEVLQDLERVYFGVLSPGPDALGLAGVLPVPSRPSTSEPMFANGNI